ncbi:MAG: hypothetical protein AAFP84_11165 [Actinomycetota bacterium]
MSDRSAAVYERRGTHFVVAKHRTAAGYAIESSSIEVVDRVGEGDGFEYLAEAVRAALAGSRTGVPTPPTEELTSRLPETAGASSFAAFVNSAISVHVGADDDSSDIVLTPMRSAGASAGFQFCTGHRITVSDRELATGLVDALAVARDGC